MQMNFIYELFGTPLGYVIWAIYQVVKNYGVAIIIFTIILKVAMLPIAIKQQKSSAKMGAFQPRIAEINKKYAKNPQKKQEELTKLYEEEGYSPMKGCLPMLIQFVILFGIIDVVYKPLTHILHLSKDVIAKAAEIIGGNAGAMNQQLKIVDAIQQDPSKFSELGQNVIDKVNSLDLNFLGLNLGSVPNWTSILIIIPILAGIFSFLQMFVSMKMNPMGETPGAGSMKMMMFVMPIFSVWITFSVPVGVGIYWILTYVVGIGQVLLLNKLYNPKELREQAIAEMEERQKARKKPVVKKEIKKDEKGNEVVVEETLSQKEINRRRLAEARKRDAEKYGEEYVEVTDDDLK